MRMRSAVGSFFSVLVVVCSLVMAPRAQKLLPNSTPPLEVSGFVFELLLTHLSQTEERIQLRLSELVYNQTTELRQLIRGLERKIDALNRRIDDLPRRGAGTTDRSQTIEQGNVPYRVERIEGFADPGLNGEWIVLQNRFDGLLSFDKDWVNYRLGFGDISAEHWLGLNKLHRLLEMQRHELLIVLETFANETAYAHYDDFRIGNEVARYAILSLGQYSGTAGDSLAFHRGVEFSTLDLDNDSASYSCAVRYRGGWWYKDCYACNLNGRYLTKASSIEDGLIWSGFKGPFISMKATKMLIRPHSGKDTGKLN